MMIAKLNSKSAILFLLALLLIVTASCEKHDGIEYYKSKCEAEFNGQFLIDQTRFDWGIGMGRTPNLQISEHEATFESKLSTERGGVPIYYVDIKLFTDETWKCMTEQQVIKFENIEETYLDSNAWEYVSDYRKYCEYNRLNYATIFRSSDLNIEIVKEGVFQITDYDTDNKSYKGIFTLTFSEGTLNAEFSIY